MIGPLRPFLPLLITKVKARLASEPTGTLAAELTQLIREELTPPEQGQLAKVLQLSARNLGV